MKKTLIALAVLGATAGVAHAQTNVVIYGIADVGYVKESGSKLKMGENLNNRLGFMGTEDLGGGLKVTFQMEQRFKLWSGKENADKGLYEGAANVGLKGSFGQVRFGRLNELSTETLRKLDPFNQFGIAAMPDNMYRGMDTEGRLSSTTRYDSPNFNGFKFGATYTVPNQSKTYIGYLDATQSTPLVPVTTDNGESSYSNQGYGLSGTYTNGPIYVVANYNKAVDSNGSHNWNIGGAYAFGPAKVSVGFEQTQDHLYTADTKENRYIVGLTYKVGAGLIKAAYNHSNSLEFTDAASKKYSLGYTHNLSKRTSVYADYAHINTDNVDSYNGYMVGMTHKF